MNICRIILFFTIFVSTKLLENKAMKLYNTIKTLPFAYNLYRNKRFFCLLGILMAISFTIQAKDQQITILQQTKSIIQKEPLPESTKKELEQRIDSITKSGQISESAFVKMISNIGVQLREKGTLTRAVELYLTVIAYYEQKTDLSKDEIKSLILFYIPLGACHDDLGLSNRAMYYYLKALSLSEKYKFEDQSAVIYNNIGSIYFKKNDLDKALTFLEKALAINKKNNNKQELFYNYNNLGGIYITRNMEDRALDYALEAIQLLDKQTDAYLYYFMQTNIAGLYLMKNEYALTMSYLRNTMIHQQKYGFHSDLIQTYNLLSETFDKMGRKDSAFIYLEKALSESQTLPNRQIESTLQRKMAKFHSTNGNYQKAYEALETAAIIGDSISAADNNKKITNMERVYDAEKKMQENELLIKDISLQKATSDRLWIIMAAFAFCLIITIVLLIYHSMNKEKQRKTQTILAQQQSSLFEKEKELQNQKEQELSHIIDQRNRELTSYTLYMIKTNEFISDINEELKQLLLELNPRDRQHKSQIQKTQIKLQQQSSTNNWDEFRYYFEQVHPSFYKNLEQSYPDLTMKEKRLCAFLRLGLSSKEIAAITFKEVRSVESARNRLRRKLNINLEENLIEFISRI